jgi:hypothetical protein
MFKNDRIFLIPLRFEDLGATRDLIRQHGGSVVESDADATLAITTLSMPKRIARNLSRSLPVTSPDWIHNCVAAGTRLDPKAFLISVSESLVAQFGTHAHATKPRQWRFYINDDDATAASRPNLALADQLKRQYHSSAPAFDSSYLNTNYECLRPTPLNGPNHELCALLDKLGRIRDIEGESQKCDCNNMTR